MMLAPGRLDRHPGSRARTGGQLLDQPHPWSQPGLALALTGQASVLSADVGRAPLSGLRDRSTTLAGGGFASAFDGRVLAVCRRLQVTRCDPGRTSSTGADLASCETHVIYRAETAFVSARVREASAVVVTRSVRAIIRSPVVAVVPWKQRQQLIAAALCC
jgi:hypothetical protein